MLSFKITSPIVGLPCDCNDIIHCSKVPAFLNIVDIAGLVKGAAEGQGLGNAFLSHIKACDAIFHLCREYNFLFDLLIDLSLHFIER